MSVMSGQNDPKLKKLLSEVPNGFLIDSHWMRERQIARQSVHDYIRRGWIEQEMPGLYRRPFTSQENNDAVHGWKIPLLSAQWLMNYDVHLGGSSALTQLGHTHYLSLGEQRTVFLYGHDLPTWLFRINVNATLEQRSLKLFDQPTTGINHLDFSPTDGNPKTSRPPWEWPIKASSAERALLEALDELPRLESFHNIDMIFQGLTSLRPRSLQALLEACTSIKVKRLFFVYADRHQHAWFKHIDKSGIDLGTGDRSLVKGGKLHPVYRITIPQELVNGQENTNA